MKPSPPRDANLDRLGRLVRKADFFGFEGDATPFDVIYERALLCALPRGRWPDWGRRVAAPCEVGRPAGGGSSHFDDNPKGPPFGIDAKTLEVLLEPGFVQLEDRLVPDEQCLPVFAGKERWQVWKRRASL